MSDEEDYDYEDEDFEDEEHSPTAKRIGTPHSSKKSNFEYEDWNEGDEQPAEKDVEGQDLESYMKQYSQENNQAADNEDLACELKPLEGVRPKRENAEEEQLLHKLGYSYSNQSSPVKGSYSVKTDNSPSPSKKQTYQQYGTMEDRDQWSSNKYDITATITSTVSNTLSNGAAAAVAADGPSTRTSKDSKLSPAPHNGSKSTAHPQKVGFSLQTESDDEDSGFTSPAKKVAQNDKPAKNASKGDYMDAFKSMIDVSSPPKNKLSSPIEPSAADLILLNKAKPTPSQEKENSERVDLLLMELFPERYEKKKPKKGGKKGSSANSGVGAGYNKNQSYGLAAPRAPASVDFLHSSSSRNHGNNNNNSYADEDDEPVPLMQNLDAQMKLLKKELKMKDDKITRLTEHAVMMGTHMDKLKGEAAYLTVQLREANLELDAKESRLQDALKQRKKSKKAAAAAGTAGGSGGADVAVLENENARLREREQALMDAIEELSNQNEDLIDKLKESMERELVLSSKRAAQISHNVSTLAEQSHHASYQQLPSIAGAAGGGLRTQSQPEKDQVIKRATRKKRA